MLRRSTSTDQYREDYPLAIEEQGNPLTASELSATNAELLQMKMPRRGENNADRIRKMVNRGGWAEADAFVVQLGLSLVAVGIGLAVRERRTAAAAICN